VLRNRHRYLVRRLHRRLSIRIEIDVRDERTQRVEHQQLGIRPAVIPNNNNHPAQLAAEVVLPMTQYTFDVASNILYYASMHRAKRLSNLALQLYQSSVFLSSERDTRSCGTEPRHTTRDIGQRILDSPQPYYSRVLLRALHHEVSSAAHLRKMDCSRLHVACKQGQGHTVFCKTLNMQPQVLLTVGAGRSP